MVDSDAAIAFKIQTLSLSHESMAAFLEATRKIPQHKKGLVARIFVSVCAKTFLGPKYRFLAEAMLNGETGHLVNVNFRSPGGASALHLAARNHDFDLIALLLSRGARTDLRGLRPHKRYHGEDGYDFNCDDKIPLELAFFSNSPFSTLIPSYWTSNSGTLFVIFMAHIATEFVWKSFELLTKNTEKIGRVVHRCVKEARPEVLGLLLLADRDKVLSSNMLEENDGFSGKHNRVMTVQEAILAEIASANEDRSNLTGQARSSLLYRKLESKEQKLTFCWKLLEVFDKVGGALNALLLSKNGQNVAVREVASLLEQCGCELSYGDTTHPGSTLDDLDDLDNASQVMNRVSDIVEVDNPIQFSNMNLQDFLRCSIMYSTEADDEYHSECSMKYDRLISDAVIVHDAERHIHHHAQFSTCQAKSTFIKFMETIPAHKTTLVNNTLIYVLHCAFESKKELFYPIYMSCILSLLNGETGHNVDVNFLGSFGITALHVAAKHSSKESVEMLLLHGASADIRAENPRDDVYSTLPFDWDDKVSGKLPLELAVRMKVHCNGEAANWTSYAGKVLDSILNLLEPKEVNMELVGLLARHTKGIRQVVVDYMKGGEVLALVALVFAAYENVVSLPLEKGIGASEGCMKISEYTMMEIVNVTEESLKEKEKGGDQSQVKELEIKKNKLMFVLYTLEAIEAARKCGKVAVKDVSRFIKGKNFSSERFMRNAKGKLQMFQNRISVLQVAPTSKTEDVVPGHTSDFGSEHVKSSLTSQMSELQLSGNPATEEASSKNTNLGRRIRLLKKKIRVARTQQKDKLTKLESWKEELQQLKEKKAETADDHDQQIN